MPDILQTTLPVKIGDDEFTFRIPSAREMGKVGMRAAEIRRRDVPASQGWDDGLDAFSANLYRGFALMEVLLEKASVDWAFTEAGGKVGVDSEKFPSHAIPTVARIYGGFTDALDTFHAGRNRD